MKEEMEKFVKGLVDYFCDKLSSAIINKLSMTDITVDVGIGKMQVNINPTGRFNGKTGPQGE